MLPIPIWLNEIKILTVQFPVCKLFGGNWVGFRETRPRYPNTMSFSSRQGMVGREKVISNATSESAGKLLQLKKKKKN